MTCWVKWCSAGSKKASYSCDEGTFHYSTRCFSLRVFLRVRGIQCRVFGCGAGPLLFWRKKGVDKEHFFILTFSRIHMDYIFKFGTMSFVQKYVQK